MADMGKMVDFTNVEEPSFKPIPEGIYNATFFDYEFKESKKGNEMINVTFKITDGDFADKKVWFLQMLHDENARGYWLATLKNMLGMTKEEIIENLKEPNDLDKYLGSNCRIKIYQQKYQGDVYSKVKRVLPAKEENDDFTL